MIFLLSLLGKRNQRKKRNNSGAVMHRKRRNLGTNNNEGQKDDFDKFTLKMFSKGICMSSTYIFLLWESRGKCRGRGRGRRRRRGNLTLCRLATARSQVARGGERKIIGCCIAKNCYGSVEGCGTLISHVAQKTFSNLKFGKKKCQYSCLLQF